MGHCTYASLTCRPFMCIFYSAYAFIRAAGGNSVRIWRSVREEFLAFRSLLAMCQSDWARQWSTYVTQTDASESGLGVATAEWPRDVVASCGRTSERSRFKRAAGSSARVRALEGAGFEKIDDQWVPTAVLPEHRAAIFGEWQLRGDFPEVPAEWLRSERWQSRLSRAWEFPEGIVHLEARALVTGVQRVSESVLGQNACYLFLCDNMSVVLAVERCRSHDFRLLRHVRRFCAYSLSRNLRTSVRWIPSELNSADAGSRRFDEAYDVSKDLSGRIPGSDRASPILERPVRTPDGHVSADAASGAGRAEAPSYAPMRETSQPCRPLRGPEPRHKVGIAAPCRHRGARSRGPVW